MKIKRILAAFAAAVLLLSISACKRTGGTTDSPASDSDATSQHATVSDLQAELPTSKPEFDVSAYSAEDFPVGKVSYVSSMRSDIELIAALDSVGVYLYAVRNPEEKNPCGAVVRIADGMRYYNWDILNKYLTDATEIALYDYDGDGAQELAAIVLAESGNNRYVEQLRVIELDGNDPSQNIIGAPAEDILFDSDTADSQLRAGMNYAIADGKLTLTYESSSVTFDVTKFLKQYGPFTGLSEFGGISKFSLEDGGRITASFGVGLLFGDGEGDVFCSDISASVEYAGHEFLLTAASLSVYDKY